MAASKRIKAPTAQRVGVTLERVRYQSLDMSTTSYPPMAGVE